MNRASSCATVAALLLAASPLSAWAEIEAGSQPSDSEETWAVHGQATFVVQGHPAFRSPYQGPNSLDPEAGGRETFDVTLYAGVRPWSGGEIWINPEIDQGFGLSNTLGVAGFPSGEAYKVGKRDPYPKLPRLFLRQTVNLGGEREKVDPDINQLGGTQTADRLVLTLGKFSVVDVFDTNQYAHDPRRDFLNWAIIDAGTFDYAANAWGYTYGLAAEIYHGRWTARAGVFDLSDVPNSARLDPTFTQFQLVGELEERHEIAGQPGALKLTLFETRGRMGRFADAIRLAQATGQPADITAVRDYRSRRGVSFNLEQQVAPDLGLFLKGGVANGDTEPYEFADIDRTVAAGFSMKGDRWARPDDTWALAGVLNGIAPIHQEFLDTGGLGILVGDGQLPRPGDEQILETYYDIALVKPLHLSLDYQFVNHPAYNRDRGPVSIGAVRLHVQF
jgi:high affinity Mn2+ porin